VLWKPKWNNSFGDKENSPKRVQTLEKLQQSFFLEFQKLQNKLSLI